MTKLEQLRETVSAMTEAPWEERGGEVWSLDGCHPDYDMRVAVAGREDGDTRRLPINHLHAKPNAAGIAALRNAAPAMLEVIEAAQRYMVANDRQDLSGDAYYMRRADANAELRDALARLENLLP